MTPELLGSVLVESDGGKHNFKCELRAVDNHFHVTIYDMNLPYEPIVKLHPAEVGRREQFTMGKVVFHGYTHISRHDAIAMMLTQLKKML